MNKLATLIKELSYEDLQLLKKDYDAGHIEKLLKKQLAQKKAQKKTVCPVCGEKIAEGKGFHLQFGPRDLRKKATFDGIDCLKYFLNNHNNKKTKEEVVIVQESDK